MTRRREDQARPAGRSARPHRLVRVDESVTVGDLIAFAIVVTLSVSLIVAPPAGLLGVDGRHVAIAVTGVAALARPTTPRSPR